MWGGSKFGVDYDNNVTRAWAHGKAMGTSMARIDGDVGG
jgi:hypothetical protein